MKKLISIHALLLFLIVFDACQSTDSSPPVADFTIKNQKVTANQVVRFKNLSSKIISYRWDFGDGMASTDFEPTHIYRQSGDYTITLTAKTQQGSTVIVQAVTVLPDGIMAQNSMKKNAF